MLDYKLKNEFTAILRFVIYSTLKEGIAFCLFRLALPLPSLLCSSHHNNIADNCDSPRTTCSAWKKYFELR